MKNNLLMNFTVDKDNKKINVQREFAANLDKVWAAWTTSELLDQWWAPKPYQVKTKSMDFRVGGFWLYAMVSPEGDAHWCRADYKSIEPLKSFSALDAFCDEEGQPHTTFPRSLWTNSFQQQAEHTLVSIVVAYEDLADLEKIIEMGFKEGFTMAMENLDAYFAG